MRTPECGYETSGKSPPPWNGAIGWASCCAGALLGMVLGLWSFDGPLPVPSWIGDYESVSRRMIRLAHIACFGLGFVNILFALNYPALRNSDRAKKLASGSLVFGNALMPVLLLAAAAFHPLKYLLALPACAVATGLALTAAGLCRASRRDNQISNRLKRLNSPRQSIEATPIANKGGLDHGLRSRT